MKKYIKPVAKTINISNCILAGSGGVKDGSTPGNEYNSEDESYSKGSIWHWMGEEE